MPASDEIIWSLADAIRAGATLAFATRYMPDGNDPVPEAWRACESGDAMLSVLDASGLMPFDEHEHDECSACCSLYISPPAAIAHLSFCEWVFSPERNRSYSYTCEACTRSLRGPSMVPEPSFALFTGRK